MEIPTSVIEDIILHFYYILKRIKLIMTNKNNIFTHDLPKLWLNTHSTTRLRIFM